MPTQIYFLLIQKYFGQEKTQTFAIGFKYDSDNTVLNKYSVTEKSSVAINIEYFCLYSGVKVNVCLSYYTYLFH